MAPAPPRPWLCSPAAQWRGDRSSQRAGNRQQSQRLLGSAPWDRCAQSAAPGQLQTPPGCRADCIAWPCSKSAGHCAAPCLSLAARQARGRAGATDATELVHTVFFWVSVAVMSALLPSVKACAMSDSSRVSTVHSTKSSRPSAPAHRRPTRTLDLPWWCSFSTADMVTALVQHKVLARGQL